MSWLSDLLKHIQLSRAFTGAIFVTAGCLHFGPKYFDGVIDPVPVEFSVIVVGALIFSGSMLAFWASSSIYGISRGAIIGVWQAFRARRLSERELQALMGMARDPNRAFDVGKVNYEDSGVTRLEVVETFQSLCRKGLSYDVDGDRYVLTKSGRARAFEILQKAKNPK